MSHKGDDPGHSGVKGLSPEALLAELAGPEIAARVTAPIEGLGLSRLRNFTPEQQQELGDFFKERCDSFYPQYLTEQLEPIETAESKDLDDLIELNSLVKERPELAQDLPYIENRSLIGGLRRAIRQQALHNEHARHFNELVSGIHHPTSWATDGVAKFIEGRPVLYTQWWTAHDLDFDDEGIDMHCFIADPDFAKSNEGLAYLKTALEAILKQNANPSRAVVGRKVFPSSLLEFTLGTVPKDFFDDFIIEEKS